MTNTKKAALVFGAGFGTRMGSLTAGTPKPLLRVAGHTLLDRALDIARSAGAAPIAVNTHYLADQIDAHLAGQEIHVLNESPEILDTGGGLRNALDVLGKAPLFTLNPDCAWQGPNPLSMLADVWDPDQMRALLLVVPSQLAEAHGGTGDFRFAEDGLLKRGGDYVYTGAQIIDPSALDEFGKEVFSLNAYWNALDQSGGIHGLVYDGVWCDVGHPDGLRRADHLLGGTTDV